MPNNVERVIKETHQTTVDEQGEVKSEIHEKTIYKAKEPDYIKLYINTLLAFKDLPKKLDKVLMELLSYMSYAGSKDKDGGQKIYTNASMKKDIAERLGMKVNTLDKALVELVKSNLLKRVGTGTYQVNPHVFGKGEWRDISAIRATFDFNTGEIDTVIITNEDE
jgi:predicted Rossmann fold nucleotide-binding protein DprA/Smf involved in DNA uptake